MKFVSWNIRRGVPTESMVATSTGLLSELMSLFD